MKMTYCAFMTFIINIAIIASVSAGEMRTLCETRDERHIAVIGDGFLSGEDSSGRAYFIRTGTLAQDEHGRLCAQVDDGLLVLSPPIHVPDTAVRLLISPDGSVSALRRGKPETLELIGRLSLNIIRHRVGARIVAPGVITFDDAVVPKAVEFGEESQIFILQGWLQKSDAHKVGRRGASGVKNKP